MAKVKINENGQMIDAQTGKSLGNVRSGINFNSADSQIKTLQEMGVEIPEVPDDIEEQDDDQNDENDIVVPLIKEQQKNNEQVRMNNVPSSFKNGKSKYIIDNNTYFIIRFGLYQKLQDNRIIPIRNEDIDDYHFAEKHWVKFRMWSYREELRWKQECTEYHSASHMQIINQEKLNEKKIRQLMLDWSFGEYDDELKLLHCNGVLSDESYNLFYNMYPSIANTIVDLMNAVLESNQ